MSGRASVTSQVVPQPFILAATSASSTTTTPGMSRNTAATKAPATKHDSAVSIGGLVQKVAKRGKRPASDPETMAPVYRLYPHQASNGRRELRAMERPENEERSQTSLSNHTRGQGRLGSVDHTRLSHSPAGSTREAQADGHQKRFSARHAHTQSESQLQRNDSLRTPVADSGTAPAASDISNISSNNNNNLYGSAPPGTATEDPTLGLAISEPNGVHRTASQSLMTPARNIHADAATTHTSIPPSPDAAEESYEAGARSSAGSVFSNGTSASSVHTLPPLQSKGLDHSEFSNLEPVIEDDPSSWDLVGPAPVEQDVGIYELERRAEQLFSSAHLRIIFEDPRLLLKFTSYLNTHRPQSIPILIYYLDALKAIRAIGYANAIAEALEPIKGQSFTQDAARPTYNAMLEEKANLAFDQLVQEDLPAYIAHTWVTVVSISIQRRITGTLAPHLREASEGLAEVFCLTDPSRTDSPIVFASEEFTRTTQYGMNYLIGRNCRFLQGPQTTPESVRRLATATAEGKEHTEVLVNYRRDGSPFMNLLMIAPLMDSRGNIRYYIGAQVDVSGLLKDCAEMDGLLRLVEKEQQLENAAEDEEDADHKDEFQELSEMFNGAELDTVRKCGGRMHKEYVDDNDTESITNGGRPRLLLKDASQELLRSHASKRSISDSIPISVREKINGKLEGIYSHYLLIRPAPSLRILFTSPSLRVPGILQSPFLNRIGGSSRVRSDLRTALAEGRGVTARIRWLTRPDEDGEGEGRPRWIHCTPLLGHSGAVGVWMVVLVDDEQSGSVASARRFRQAPPISNVIGGKEWDASQAQPRDRRLVHHYDKIDTSGIAHPAANGESPAIGTATTTSIASPIAATTSPIASGAVENRRISGVYQQDFTPTGNRNRSRSRPGRAEGSISGTNLISSGASEFSFNLKG